MNGFCDTLPGHQTERKRRLKILETENSETAILIEVKYAGDGNLDVACERALKQVEERKYDEELRENGVDKILKYGIACYMKRCKVKLSEESYIET